MRGSRLTVEPLGGGSTSFIVRAPPSSPLVPTGLSAAAAAAAIVAARVAGSLAAAAVALVALLVLRQLSRHFTVHEESLTAIEGVGLQLCTRSAAGRETTRFIEAAAISAVFLAESVRFDRCYFYFACLLHSKDGHGEAPQMVVPFPHLLPPLADLQRVHDGVWDALRRGAECTYDESCSLSG